MSNLFHSVTLEQDKCKGCINCMKRCPTEAIRVRNGKATILSERCIDCGECIKHCSNRAKKAVTDSLEMIHHYKWKVALPAPSFYGQFNNLDDINYVLSGLLQLGFDAVYEVSGAAEIISDLTRRIINSNENLKKPVISSACPAVVKLISVRFPELCSHMLPVLAPVELAAKNAREEAVLKTGYKSEEIGIFFISPCPAKVTAAKAPLIDNGCKIDGVISANEVYTKLLGLMNKISAPEQLSKSGIVGLAWANSGGESAALLKDKYLAADGIENVIKVLEEVEDEKLNNLDFIELNACTGGCVGGVLNIENPFVAKARLLRLRKYLPLSCNKLTTENLSPLKWSRPLEYAPVMLLNSDFGVAMEMMQEIERITAELPGLDCGSCGAPSCKAFAEDMVKGLVSEDDCVIKLRDKLRQLHSLPTQDEQLIPAPFRE